MHAHARHEFVITMCYRKLLYKFGNFPGRAKSNTLTKKLSSVTYFLPDKYHLLATKYKNKHHINYPNVKNI